MLTSGADQNGSSLMGERRSFVRKPYDLIQVEQWLRSMIERRGAVALKTRGAA
jgi:hypothetical protein